MSDFHRFNLLYFKGQSTDNWILIGIDAQDQECYSMVVMGNDCTQTRRFKLNAENQFHEELVKNGYFRVYPDHEKGSTPPQVMQRTREWWKFVHCGKIDLMWGNNPWGNSVQAGDSVNGEGEVQKRNDCIEDPSEHDSDYENKQIMEFGDFDNYWNREGIFESASDFDDLNRI